MAGLDHTGQRRYRHSVEDASVVFADYPEHRQAIFITGPDNHQESAGNASVECCRHRKEIRTELG